MMKIMHLIIIFPKGYGNSPAVLFDSSYSIVL